MSNELKGLVIKSTVNFKVTLGKRVSRPTTRLHPPAKLASCEKCSCICNRKKCGCCDFSCLFPDEKRLRYTD